jgi:hypothetical protein
VAAVQPYQGIRFSKTDEVERTISYIGILSEAFWANETQSLWFAPVKDEEGLYEEGIEEDSQLFSSHVTANVKPWERTRA